MAEWWNGLSATNQVFYGVAVFFSVFFIWQLLAALVGLGGEDVHADADADAGDVDADVDGGDLDHDGTYEHFEHGAHADAAESVASFKILSVRSIITFFTLFTWGGALYLNTKTPLAQALSYSAGWGLAGMFIIALLLYWMRRLTESGTGDIKTCLGCAATVYLDIPEGGLGEVRTAVSGVMSHVKARAADGVQIKAGSPVTVSRILDNATVEVTLVDQQKGAEP